MWCDLIVGVATDFAEAAIQAAFKPTAEIVVADLEARFSKFGPRFETRLEDQDPGYCAADSMTFADIILSKAISSYLEWCPDILNSTPRFKSLYERVVGDAGIAAYLESELRYPKPGNDYVIGATRVLRRALPTHMSNANRFVASI
jgi:hypothetical protein